MSDTSTPQGPSTSGATLLPPGSATAATDGAQVFRMQSNLPANKVTAAALAAAVVEILLWLNTSYGGPQIPTGVTSSLTVIVTLLAGYFMPPGRSDRVVRLIDPVTG